MFLRAVIALYVALIVSVEAVTFLGVWPDSTLAAIAWRCVLADLAMIVIGVLGAAERPPTDQGRLPAEAVVVGVAFLASFWHILRGVLLMWVP